MRFLLHLFSGFLLFSLDFFISCSSYFDSKNSIEMSERMIRSYSLTCTKLTLFTLSAVVIQIVGLSLFIVSFFPVKPSLSGLSGLESFYPPGSHSSDMAQNFSTLLPQKLKSLYQELARVPPLFDRLILMVIDGLPAEFVLGKDGKPPDKAFAEAMPYTQSLLAGGLAVGYHAKAAPPTVTMPRLKAMVSGAIGGFLDVASNFNTQAFLDDNLIAQFLRIGWKMVMLGDETWLKLFPNMFNRHDGVSSFFVKDTIQVDYNVTRHLTNELDNADWDLLILHYLGLDHVGHIGGRNSILMAPKLMEMDEVIKRIHSSITPFQETNRKGTLLMIVSDHGMTQGGNHGGSSFEETDSLALFVSGSEFVNAEKKQEAYQVDIASTLALLFGVPIPKNNVGTVMMEVFTSLEDDQLLRILELNSLQLLRLLETHFPELACETLSCESGMGQNGVKEMFCCSYLAATALHKSWTSKNLSRSVDGDDYRSTVHAYRDFLGTTSKWLSTRSTDKPTGLLAMGIAAMSISCVALMSLLFIFSQEVAIKETQHSSHTDNNMHKWNLSEYFTVAVISILILSMGSSSMVEEEQYIWHFMTTSLNLVLLRQIIQSTKGLVFSMTSEQKGKCPRTIYYIILVLIFGRILRGWHQGGVNWSYLPDISKLLEQSGTVHIKSMHLLSLVLIIICLALILRLRLKTRSSMLMVLVYLFPAVLILDQISNYGENRIVTSSGTETTKMVQIIHALIGISTVGILAVVPWLMPSDSLNLFGDGLQENHLEGAFKHCMFVIGWCYVLSWCLLQMLLQQPINSMPTCLLLVQILLSMRCVSEGGLHVKQWVKVAALYYLGMAGHFALGNTNSLATIDVAGAFIGISTHSTIISGILMFVITYASPMLALLSMLMDVSMGVYSSSQDSDFGHLLKMSLGYPCLVPLGLNSILLLAYTIVLLLMRNHLFVWSVFSPKYLYVCATTACVYIGVSVMALTATYTCVVFATRRKLMGS